MFIEEIGNLVQLALKVLSNNYVLKYRFRRPMKQSNHSAWIKQLEKKGTERHTRIIVREEGLYIWIDIGLQEFVNIGLGVIRRRLKEYEDRKVAKLPGCGMIGRFVQAVLAP